MRGPSEGLGDLAQPPRLVRVPPAGDREVLVASNGAEVAEHLRALHPARARAIAQRARVRILAHHTYAQRALQVHEVLEGSSTQAGAAG